MPTILRRGEVPAPGHHRPPGDPENVGGHHGEFDARVLEEFFDPILLRGAGADQIDAVAGQIPQLPDRLGRHETRAQHLPFGHFAQPDGVQLVGLGSTGQMFDVAGINQPRVQPVRLEQVEHRLPVG
jgi:hypothetical protein